jgi:membrane protein YdbS with pleckstrin-like domain
MHTTLRHDENKLLVVREHWLVLVPPAVIAVVVVAAAVAAAMRFSAYWWIPTIIALVFIFNFVWKILQRKTNIWVITNLRVIDEYGVISSHSVESPLDKINNVEFDQSIWGRLFDYGDVTLQTAAEMGETVYRFLVHPKQVQTTIFNAQGDFIKDLINQHARGLADAIQGTPPASSSTGDFESEMERLYKLKTQGILSEAEYNQRKQKLLNS